MSIQSLFVPGLALFLAATVLGVPSGPAAADPPPAPAPAASGTPSASEVVAQVQDFYDKANTFKANFTQSFYVKAYNITKTSNGSVTFKKPGKMDWKYDVPKGNRVVSNGSKVWVLEATQVPPQVWEQQVDKSQYPAALSFLTGTGKLTDTFNFQVFAGETNNLQFPGGNVLVGTPKVANPAYTKVLFYVDRASKHVRRVMVVDAQQNKNRFDFTEPQINLPVADRTFDFTAPAGSVPAAGSERR